MEQPTSLGVYQILSPLGAGGMGEVYRARDPRLRRDVAVKILPSDAVLDPERLKRFEQEAQAASALNHPNILVVHDFGDENGIHYLVSELVHGESLRKLIQTGPISIKKLLDIAVQIADGLAAAHQAGIVHRDLKPENIMVTPENRVKILDFGLAKLAQTGGEDTETVSQVMTQSGIISGTVPYMSPEQASGKTLDFRSDQFSFGLILYEMATGKRAFQKDTGVQILSAIISEEPPPISTLNPAVPAPLRWIIERCMNKEARQRYDSSADLYRELRNLKDHLSEASVTVERTAAVRPPSRFQHPIALAMILLAAILTAVITSFLIKKDDIPDLSSHQFTRLMTGTRATYPPSWSPDSKSIAYVSDVDGVRQVFTKDLESLVSNQITNVKHPCFRPIWSGDGSRIYYTSRGDLWAVSAAGGPSELILKNVEFPWLSDQTNTLVFRRTEQGKHSLWISSPPGAEPKKYPSLPPNTKRISDGAIKFSPDGSKISLWVGTNEHVGFWLLPYPSGKPSKIELPKEVLHPSPYSWMPDNQHVVFGGSPVVPWGRSNLWMIGLDAGTSRPLTAGYASPEASPSVSPDGLKIAFTTVDTKSDVTEIPLDGSVSRPLPADAFAVTSPVWSPSGTQYAFSGENKGIRGIWLKSVADHWTRPIVTERELKTPGFDSPSFSPDGQRVAYQMNSNEIWVSPVSGGKPIRFVSSEYAPDFPSWSPDGNWIAFNCQTQKAVAKVLATGSGVPVILKRGIEYFPTRWSPTGEWITYVVPEGLSVISPDGKTSQLVAAGTWGSHGWSHDGSTIYGLKFEGKRVFLCSVDLRTRLEKRLNELARTDNAEYYGFSLSPDASSVITAEIRFYGTIWLLEGFAKPTGFFARLRNNFN